MATYPGGIYSPTALTDGVDNVLASHQNTPNQELVAIETELGTNPKTITEATAPAASPASVAEFLDMVATAIKAFKGTAAHWYTALTGTPSATTFLRGDGSWAIPVYPSGFLYGLKLSNNGSDATNDIDIATGEARDSTDAADMVLASALTKQLDAAWAVGTNQGGLDTGAVGNNTYHVWLIKRSDTGVVDVLFSLSASTPTMPANYNYKRRIGSIIRSGGAILAFSQNGDEFLLTTRVADVNGVASSASAALKTLTVPAGIKVDVLATLRADYASSSTAVLVTSPDETDQAATTQVQSVTCIASTSTTGSTLVRVRTDTSSQIRLRSSGTGATVYITTYGWIDTRGRLS